MNGKRKDSRSQSDIQPSNQSERESGTAHAMKKKKMDSHESNVAICKCRMRDKKKCCTMYIWYTANFSE